MGSGCLVGFAYSKTNNDSADFYLGGRKMGPLVTAMSAEASDMSSWLLMGCLLYTSRRLVHPADLAAGPIVRNVSVIAQR